MVFFYVQAVLSFGNRISFERLLFSLFSDADPLPRSARPA